MLQVYQLSYNETFQTQMMPTVSPFNPHARPSAKLARFSEVLTETKSLSLHHLWQLDLYG